MPLLLSTTSVSAQGQFLTEIRFLTEPDKTTVLLKLSSTVNYEMEKNPQGTRFLLTLSNTASNISTHVPGPENSLIEFIDETKGASSNNLQLRFKLVKQSTSQLSYLKTKGSDEHVLRISFTDKQSMENQSSVLLERARVAITKGEFNRAIALYDSVIALGLPKDTRLAKEFQAVAHQKARHFTLAKASYQRYLELYPQGFDSDRVRQRLAVILTLDQSRPRLKPSTKRSRVKNGPSWNNHGGIYQYYRFSSNIDDAGNSKQVLNALSTDLQLSSRYRNKSYDLDIYISGGQFNDLLDEGPGNSSRLSYLYVVGVDREIDRKIKIGRQRRYGGGVVGRFDGVSVDNPFADSFSANFVAGYPVDSSKQTTIENQRFFYGFNMDWQTWGDRLDLNFFIINQDIDGLTDRQAIGGQANYFDSRNYLFSLIDYDIHFDELNAVMLNGNHNFENGTNLSLSVNFSKSPYLSTRNALIGQPVDSVDELVSTFFTVDEIEDLALDRTTESKTSTIAVVHPLNDQYDISGSFTIAKLSDTPGSGGVMGFEASNNDHYYSTELVGKGVFINNDVSIVGLRYSNLNTSTITSTYATVRLPLWPGWRINPRFGINFRENTNGTEQWIYSPRIQCQYRWRRNLYFELETGSMLYDQNTIMDESEQFQFHFFYMGYRYLF